ncbi:hypothetical protein H634G_07757 [Metarhizium anisopliae BRIP 53293]|uniref:Uncharacterized protein n=1 Tax=Metarhizium anisopliae BRIP 53293 TaxID=1291518 RepID=A0A0D9NSA6_METAN|nr:hypothetical protein H634G_07757 [Metarhizium anisopliae BRIP 53293]KJK89148.1 hypothetical protein H633G_07004 [Metarhizium anisopliae BRIP 53284]
MPGNNTTDSIVENDLVPQHILSNYIEHCHLPAWQRQAAPDPQRNLQNLDDDALQGEARRMACELTLRRSPPVPFTSVLDTHTCTRDARATQHNCVTRNLDAGSKLPDEDVIRVEIKRRLSCGAPSAQIGLSRLSLGLKKERILSTRSSSA